MGAVIEYPLGDIIKLELNYRLNGLPIDSLSVKVSIRRNIDNYFFDFNDETWKNSGWITKSVAMNNIGDGVYQYEIDSSILSVTPITFSANYTVETTNYESTDSDLILLGVSEISPSSIASRVWEEQTSIHNNAGTFGQLVNNIGIWSELIKDVEEGRWQIKDKQMIFYKADNITELFRFDLYDVDGNPTDEFVAHRVRV